MSRTTDSSDRAAELRDRFGFVGERAALEIVEGEGGLICARLRLGEAEATVYLHGAHVTAYTPGGGRPLLFLGRSARFEPGKAIRGGVPICFPWFGARAADPAAPSHGLARTRAWDLVGAGRIDGGVEVQLATRIEGLDALYRVNLGDALTLSLEATNRTEAAVRVEQVLHTYFLVGDIREGVMVTGLEGAAYLDQLRSRRRVVEGDEPIRFQGETDRIYLDTAPRKVIVDPLLRRRIVVETEGAPTTVLWNPWIEKTARMGDLEEDEWPRMLCLETGAVADDALRLAPGATSRLVTRMSARTAGSTDA